ncbi:DNA-directed RNA polymerase III, subunit Rpc31 [Lipomyces tetrasporus]|uniref:DNA-directed RNA polymerase III subunit n=1 Tax=Lipomyces tetrasporus TaxID=54092 RepID=A0AAD7QLY4_9ASCO|nr:DNA-directed RNA polymerase III, subunit Rpc31 [Lipomyces tetrasporus]KAJ8097737.1 DNA-directed RNA polymerase III, subunit Rpc31 [Lipomyces tetrasporus]
MSFRGGRGGRLSRDSGRPTLFGTDIKPEFTPSELYPDFDLPIQANLTDFEKRSVHQFLQYQQDVRDSAFYVSDKKKGVVEYEGGINDGIKRYSDRYLTKRKLGKSVTDHPYIIEFFPQELYSALGVKPSNITMKPKRRRLDLAQFRDSVEQEEAEGEVEAEADGVNGAAKLDAGAEDDEDENQRNEDDDEDEEEEEDEFEEDEEGDYNAERYFDDGEDDYDDGGGEDEAAY